MKHKYLIYALLWTGLAAGATSCDEDEMPQKPEPSPVVDSELPEGPKLEVGTELFDLKPDASVRQQIVSGAGDYRIDMLDTSIATAMLDGDVITVTGHKYGRTDLVVSDAGGAYKSIPVNVYLSDELQLSTTTLDLTLNMGNPGVGTVTIVAGNPPYSAVSADTQYATVVPSTVSDSGFDITGLKEGGTTITITDSRGLESVVTVTNTYSDSPFSNSDLETYKSISQEGYFWLQGGDYNIARQGAPSSKRYWATPKKDEIITNQPEGTWFFGYYASSKDSPKDRFGLLIANEKPDLATVGEITDPCYIVAYDGESGKWIFQGSKKIPTTAEVIKVEDKLAWITFYTIQEEVLYKGCFIIRLP